MFGSELYENSFRGRPRPRPRGCCSSVGITRVEYHDLRKKGHYDALIVEAQLTLAVLGLSHDGKRISPEGLKVSEMNNKKAVPLQVIAKWLGIMNDTYILAHPRAWRRSGPCGSHVCFGRPD